MQILLKMWKFCALPCLIEFVTINDMLLNVALAIWYGRYISLSPVLPLSSSVIQTSLIFFKLDGKKSINCLSVHLRSCNGGSMGGFQQPVLWEESNIWCRTCGMKWTGLAKQTRWKIIKNVGQRYRVVSKVYLRELLCCAMCLQAS